jgi:hypothetical protein
MNNTARKYPRTLTEAFGPYTSKSISDDDEPMPLPDLVVTVISIVGLTGALFAIFAGWI